MAGVLPLWLVWSGRRFAVWSDGLDGGSTRRASIPHPTHSQPDPQEAQPSACNLSVEAALRARHTVYGMRGCLFESCLRTLTQDTCGLTRPISQPLTSIRKTGGDP